MQARLVPQSEAERLTAADEGKDLGRVLQVDATVLSADASITAASARAIALEVVQDLLIDARALDSLDARLAATAEVGPPLQKARATIAASRQTESRSVPAYRFTALRLVLARNPSDYQASLEVTVEVRATVTAITYAGLTGQQVVGQSMAAMDRIFALQLVAGHYLLAGDYTR